MRGIERTRGSLFSDVDLEARVPARHPLRAMRDLADAALDGDLRPFHAHAGRPSIAPGQLRRRDACRGQGLPRRTLRSTAARAKPKDAQDRVSPEVWRS